MRIVLQMEPSNEGQHQLPLNYQYPVSAWIYRVLSQGNHEFAQFLHERGYGTGNKSFKFFTFSMLDYQGHPYRIMGDRIVFNQIEARLILSFMVPQALEHFIIGLFKSEETRIGDHKSSVTFRITAVEALPEPPFVNTNTWTTLSPLLISEQIEGRRAARYCQPQEEGYGKMLVNNLISKYMAAVEGGFIMSDTKAGLDHLTADKPFQLLNTPRKKGITIKDGTPQQTKIIGYMYPFSLTIPPILSKIGYLTGFGEKNSLGMGCCEMITNTNPNQNDI